MSQYPSPFSPPPYPSQVGYYPASQHDPLSAAKRAGLLMIILGALGIVVGVCMGAGAQMMRTATLPPEVQSQIQQLETQSGVSLSTIIAGFSGFLLILAILMIVLGVLVRGGKMLAIILSIIVTSIAVMFLAIAVLGGVVGVVAQHAPQMAAGVCFWSVPLALFVLQLFWLIQAARSSPRAATLQQQYQAQYWQYQQNMQAYQNAGYGYAAPPPASGAAGAPAAQYGESALTPPPPPPPPPTSSSPEDLNGPRSQG